MYVLFPVFCILIASTGNVLAEGKSYEKVNLQSLNYFADLIIASKCEKSVFKISKKY